MDEMIFMAMAFEHEDLLRDAAEAVRNEMSIEEAARDYCVLYQELKALCESQR